MSVDHGIITKMFRFPKNISINNKTRRTDNFAVVSIFFQNCTYIITVIGLHKNILIEDKNNRLLPNSVTRYANTHMCRLPDNPCQRGH